MKDSSYINGIKKSLPTHLHRFIQDYNYNDYTPEDHSLWRYILRQLKFQLSGCAYKDYLDGLKKAGIEVEYIPKISSIDTHLQEFGWRAVPVSGFIPPAAFMEFQANKILPVATAIRSIEHTHYTPAPDIIHEAAGHAPMLINTEFSAYLQKYALMATKAIYSKKDIDVYNAIRKLSDLKERPNATTQQVLEQEQNLKKVLSLPTPASEAAQIATMNWWTAEYGLIGDISEPKILGAGLLSSIGESRLCLNKDVKKVALSLDCLNYSYDITNPQPQLFVAKDFKHLSDVLGEYESNMAFKIGGIDSANKALESKTVNTFILETGLQISGVLDVGLSSSGAPSYIKFSSPTQICLNNKELKGHGKDYHAEGYSSPLGYLENGENLSLLTKEQLSLLDIEKGMKPNLKFKSGITVTGTVTDLFYIEGRISLISFKDCSVKDEYKNILFEPSWGIFDMAVSCEISGVFGGPADSEAYHFSNDFDLIIVPEKRLENKVYEIYTSIHELKKENTIKEKDILKILNLCSKNSKNLWLAMVELLEISYKIQDAKIILEVETRLHKMASKNEDLKTLILDGIHLAKEFNLSNDFALDSVY